MQGYQTHLKATAFHEAGHAVMGLYVGRQVAGIIISTRDPGAGVTGYSTRRPGPAYSPWTNCGSAKAAWVQALQGLKDDIRVYLAGPLAEAKALGKPLRAIGARSDLDKALRAANRIDGLAEGLSEYADLGEVSPGDEILRQLRRETRAFVGRPGIWRMIVDLAMALERERQIDATRLHQILARSGPQNELGEFTLFQNPGTSSSSVGRGLPRPLFGVWIAN